MQTSPPASGRALIAAWIEVYLPKLSTPSPTVTVQQQPQESLPSLLQHVHGLRQSVAVPASKLTTERPV
jgi:hypothetical protein